MKRITLALVLALLLGACSSGNDGLTPEECEEAYSNIINNVISLPLSMAFFNQEVNTYNEYLRKNGCSQRIDVSHCDELYAYYQSYFTMDYVCSIGLERAEEERAEAEAALLEAGCASGWGLASVISIWHSYCN